MSLIPSNTNIVFQEKGDALYKTLDPKKVSIFVDDKEIPDSQLNSILNTITPSDILSIDVLRGEKAMEKAGKESVLLIRTKKK